MPKSIIKILLYIIATIIVIIILGNAIDLLNNIGTRQFNRFYLTSAQVLFTLSISLLFSYSHIYKILKAIKKSQIKIKYNKIITAAIILFLLLNMNFLQMINVFIINTFSFPITTFRFFEIFLFFFWYNLIHCLTPINDIS